MGKFINFASFEKDISIYKGFNRFMEKYFTRKETSLTTTCRGKKYHRRANKGSYTSMLHIKEYEVM